MAVQCRGLIHAGVCSVAAAIRWLEVFPQVKREIDHWRHRANAIPDRSLARLALDTHAGERGHLEGAAIFALLAPRQRRYEVVRAAIAFQALYDFLDTLVELPVPDPVANGHRLHTALIAAVNPAAEEEHYFEYSGFDAGDGGYVRELIDACRSAIAQLPNYYLVAESCLTATMRMAEYQTFNHAPGAHIRGEMRTWALRITPPCSGLLWWESAAGAADSLGVFALIASAACPSLTAVEAQNVVNAYFPWVGALNVLLDSLVDRERDLSSGDHCLVSHYDTLRHASERLARIGTESAERTEALAQRSCHSLILAAMTSFYLTKPGLRKPGTAQILEDVLRTQGPYAGPALTMLRLHSALPLVT